MFSAQNVVKHHIIIVTNRRRYGNLVCTGLDVIKKILSYEHGILDSLSW